MDGLEFNEDMNLVGFDAWVKTKAENGDFNLKQLLENMFSTSKSREVVTPT